MDISQQKRQPGRTEYSYNPPDVLDDYAVCEACIDDETKKAGEISVQET